MSEEGNVLSEILGNERNGARRLFELYVDQLQGDSEALDEALLVRLRYFGENVERAMARLGQDPTAAFGVIRHLSTMVQELDAEAGAADRQHVNLTQSRRWALLLPETGNVYDDEEPST